MFTVSRSVCWKLSATTPLHWSTLRLGPTPVYAGPQDSQWWWWFLFVFLPDLWYFWLCCISVVPSVAAMLRAVLGDCWLEWWSGGVPTCLPVVTQTRPRQHLSEREWTLARDEAMSSCQLSSHVTTGFHWFPPVITTLGREQSVSQSVSQSCHPHLSENFQWSKRPLDVSLRSLRSLRSLVMSSGEELAVSDPGLAENINMASAAQHGGRWW